MEDKARPGLCNEQLRVQPFPNHPGIVSSRSEYTSLLLGRVADALHEGAVVLVGVVGGVGACGSHCATGIQGACAAEALHCEVGEGCVVGYELEWEGGGVSEAFKALEK